MKLLIRADGGPALGHGHLVRCLALARAFAARGGEVVFATRCEDDGLRAQLAEAGKLVSLAGAHPDPSDAEQTEALAEAADGAVLDGYGFDATYQQRLRARTKLLVIDDTARLPRFDADLLLNQNAGALSGPYAGKTEARLLLGPRYALLRPGFLPVQKTPHERLRVLVTLGGGATRELSERAVELLIGVQTPLEIRVVGTTPLPAASSSRHNLELVPPTPALDAHIGWADVALAGGGVTSLELAASGVPSLLALLADNQRSNVAGLSAAGAALNLGEPTRWSAHTTRAIGQLLADPERRADMSRRATELVDGKGCERVLDALTSLTDRRGPAGGSGDQDLAKRAGP